MAKVIIVATKYDADTRLTHRWAQSLRTSLSSSSHSFDFIDGRLVTHSVISQAITSSRDFFLFYGHGEPDRFIGQKNWWSFGSGPTLIDQTTANVFQGCTVYAVCCRALITLGPSYAALYPKGAFIGYRAPFGFSHHNSNYFRDVVNGSAIQLVNGGFPSQVVSDLKDEWVKLANNFMNGPLSSRPDAFAAGFAASGNSLFVGRQP